MGNMYLQKITSEATDNRQDKEECLSRAESLHRIGLDLCEDLKSSLEVQEYLNMKATALMNVGLVFDMKDETTFSEQFYKDSLNISQKNSYLDTSFLCCYNMADLYKRSKQFNKSIECCDLAFTMATKMRSKENQHTILSLKAGVYLLSGSYRMCRKTLHRTLKLRLSSELKKTTVSHLKIAVRLESLATQLSHPDLEPDKKLRIYEKMGDYCSDLGVFEAALRMYKDMLSSARELSWDPDQIVPIYVSLAITYSDLKEYSSAIEYSLKEIECRADSDSYQIAKTWLNIADFKYKHGDGYAAWRIATETALTFSEKANKYNQQKQILQDLIAAALKRQEEAGAWEEKLQVLEDTCTGGDQSDCEDSSQDSSQQQYSEELSDIDFGVRAFF